jgi:ABC-2 type transport system permease protein
VPTPVQLLVDASDANTAKLTAGYASRVTRAFDLAAPGSTPPGPVLTAIRLWYNPGLSSKKFYGPGIFVLGLSMFPPLLAALAMAREGEQKTILQVYVSSISAWEFLVGKILAFMAVALAECLLMLGALFTYFELRFAGDPVPFVVATVLYAFCVSSFGVMVGATIPNQVAAMQIVALGGFLLVFLLSADLSRREHPGRAALGLHLRLGPLLHRGRPRRAVAGRGMGGGVVEGDRDRRHRRRLLRGRLAGHAAHAALGLKCSRRGFAP